MSSTNLKYVPQNATEDFLDEISTCVVYKYANETLKPIEQQLQDDDKCHYEALSSALSTFKFGVMNAVIMMITEYTLKKMGVGAVMIWSYLKGGRALSKAKDFVTSKLSHKSKGRAVGRMLNNVTSIANGTQEERIALAKMANDNLNNLMTNVHQEKQTQTSYEGIKRDSFHSLLDLGTKKGREGFQKNNQAFLFKMQTGTWITTSDDKKLFEKATGVKVQETGQSSWSNLVQTLNKYAPVAKDYNDNLVNLAQTNLNLLTTMNLQRG
ncbi:MAG: hypothetical protein RBR07_04830 [Arcobacteraceae bacterium]|jgi:hypothetical protein|nr:hypothetical protein [Arcobacteraceae bacterium]